MFLLSAGRSVINPELIEILLILHIYNCVSINRANPQKGGKTEEVTESHQTFAQVTLLQPMGPYLPVRRNRGNLGALEADPGHQALLTK